MERLDRLTGFSIFVLCHRYGARGRAMLRSLALQSDDAPAFNVAVYYARQRDAEMLIEGAGLDVDLQLIQVPESKVIYRAQHFSKAKPDKPYTIFVDSDLWFPPTFLAKYAQEIESRPLGYWGAWVKNVEWEKSEPLLARWQSLTETDMAPFDIPGWRFDSCAGRVGHFQCIPTGLVRYPWWPEPGTDVQDGVFAQRALDKSVDAGLSPDRRIGPTVFHFDHPNNPKGVSEDL